MRGNLVCKPVLTIDSADLFAISKMYASSILIPVNTLQTRIFSLSKLSRLLLESRDLSLPPKKLWAPMRDSKVSRFSSDHNGIANLVTRSEMAS